MQVQSKTYPIELLTSHYQVGGEFTPRGSPAVHINDPAVVSLEISNATIIPIVSGTRIGEMKAAVTYVPKNEVQVMIFGDFTPAQAGLMPRQYRLVCFTDTFSFRGTFYVGSEFRAGDIFSLPGPFLPSTDFEIFSLRPMAIDISGEADLVYVHKNAVQVYYEQA